MNNPIRLKCCLEQHGYLELCCLNKECKANRVYCHQCLKSGDHITHMYDQKNLIELVDFFHKIDIDSENLISKLCKMVDEIKDVMFQLNQELRKKYQFSKERLQQLNAKQLNSSLHQIIQYDQIKRDLVNQLETSSSNLIKEFKIHIKELKKSEGKLDMEDIQHQKIELNLFNFIPIIQPIKFRPLEPIIKFKPLEKLIDYEFQFLPDSQEQTLK